MAKSYWLFFIWAEWNNEEEYKKIHSGPLWNLFAKSGHIFLQDNDEALKVLMKCGYDTQVALSECPHRVKYSGKIAGREPEEKVDISFIMRIP